MAKEEEKTQEKKDFQEEKPSQEEEAQETSAETKPSQEDAPKYTDAQLDEAIQARLAREKAKWEKELKDQKAKITEAQKLEKMNATEAAEYKAAQLQKQVDELMREKDFSEQMGVARKSLANDGIVLGDELLSMFVSSEAEKTKTAIDSIKKLWPKAVNDAVREALKSQPPKADPPQSKTVSAGAKFAQEYSKSMNGGK